MQKALRAMSVAMDDADLLDAHISFLETRGNATNRVRGPSRQPLPSTCKTILRTLCAPQIKQLSAWRENALDKVDELDESLRADGYADEVNQLYKQRVVKQEDTDTAEQREYVTKLLNKEYPIVANETDAHYVFPGGPLRSDTELATTLQPLKKQRAAREEDVVDVLDPDAPLGDCDVVPDQANLINAQGIVTFSHLSGGFTSPDGLRVNASMGKILNDVQTELALYVARRLERDQSCLAIAEPGSGKTLATLCATEIVKNTIKYVIVVCPKSLVMVWQQECFKWLSKCLTNMCFVYDTPSWQQGWQKLGGVLVMSHDQFKTLDDFSNLIMAPDKTAVVIDEGHLCKNPTTQLYRAVESLKLVFHRIVMLTGTPLQNSMDEFFCLLNLLRPGIVGPDLATFRKHMSDPIEAGMAENASETDSFRSWVFVRSLQDLCKDVMIISPFGLLDKQLPSQTRYQLVCMPPTQPTVTPGNFLETKARVDNETRSEKIDLVVTLMTSIWLHDKNANIVVFSGSLELLHALQSKQAGAVIEGAVNMDQRAEAALKMAADTPATHSVLYLQITVGSMGLTLTGAQYVIMAGQHYNNAHNQQAFKRVHRLTQEKETTVFTIIDNHIELGIARLCEHKQALARKLGFGAADFGDNSTSSDQILTLATKPETRTPIDLSTESSGSVLSHFAWLRGGQNVSFYKEEEAQEQDYKQHEPEDHAALVENEVNRLNVTLAASLQLRTPAYVGQRYCDGRFDMYIVFTVPSEQSFENVQLAHTVCDANGKTKAYPHPDNQTFVDNETWNDKCEWTIVDIKKTPVGNYGACRVLIAKEDFPEDHSIYFKVRMDAGSPWSPASAPCSPSTPAIYDLKSQRTASKKNKIASF
jgi:superfamily II DNA or RNA helicase